MADPECKKVLVELRGEKKKLEKLQFAISDAGQLEGDS